MSATSTEVALTGNTNGPTSEYQLALTRNNRGPQTSKYSIRLLAGSGNYVTTNHVVALDVPTTPGDSAHDAQVGALLKTQAPGGLTVATVTVDPESTGNTILDSGTEAEITADRSRNVVRATPRIEP